MYQGLAWQISVTLMLLLLAVFVSVALRSHRRIDYPSLLKRAYRLRTRIFWVLLVVVVPVMLYSMMDLPYGAPRPRQNGVQVVEIVGHQWYWTIRPDRIAAGRPVEFRVTSSDVNHGFGIYDGDMQLVAQTMAMPGYTNRLRHTFTRKGVYKILCLEYCGLAHHNMIAQLNVGDLRTAQGGMP